MAEIDRAGGEENDALSMHAMVERGMVLAKKKELREQK